MRATELLAPKADKGNVMADVSVKVPARPEFVHVFRSVIASIAARADFTFDEIDDLRLAVDEAFAQLLTIPGAATSLSMVVRSLDGGGVEVLASIDAEDAAWPPEGAERTLTWQVLSALADEARFETSDGHPAMRLTKRRVPAGAN
jgi:serine/threonine-protein kinase RsbW